MSLTDFASIGSFISGVGVLVSLFYLAFQIRQNTLTHRASAYQSRQVFLKQQLDTTMDPVLGPIFHKVLEGDETVTDAEYQLFIGLQIAWLVGQDHLVWLRSNNILDQAAYDSEDQVLRRFLRVPPIRATWEVWKPLATPAFSRVVEAHLANPAPVAPPPTVRDWKMALAAAKQDAAARA